MCKLKPLNAALALALGLGFGVAAAQTDQAAQQGNALDKPSNKADQQAVGIPAKPGTQSGEQSRQAAQPNMGPSEQSAQQFAQSGSRPSAGGDVYGWRPSEAASAQQSGRPYLFNEQFAQLAGAPGADEVYGWRPSEAINAQQNGRPYLFNEQLAQRDENKTTGQGQGVRESGGQAGVQTPAQSGDSAVERFARSGSAPESGDQGTAGDQATRGGA